MTGILPTRQSRGALSFGVGSHGRSGDLLMGVEVSYAVGRTLATNAYVEPPRAEGVPMETVRLVFILAGNTSFEAISQGVRDLVGAR